jgi:hypothetical protein
MLQKCISLFVFLAALILNANVQAQTIQSKQVTERSSQKASGRSQDVNGSVFVVTKNGNVVRLALVEVLVFEAAKFPGELEAAQLDASRIVEIAENLNQLKLEAWRSARGELEAARKDLNAMAYTTRNRDARREAEQRAWGAEPKEKRARDEMFAAEMAALVIQAPSTYVARLKNHLVRQKSDADGKFNFKLPPGEYVVSAFASRDVFGSSEQYGWMVKMTISRSSAPTIMLSNDNMAGTDCSDCVQSPRVWP